ncbi:MAG: DUF2087 domain-containing protein [Armatimonadetes bacterium]|nr:DUF2087 domain-containing protein [Armatimonadota bacterium]
MDAVVTSSEFERRVASLGLGGFGPGLPRKQRDRHILLKSVALVLGHGRSYTEPEINEVLQSWLDAIGPNARMDYVSLRRCLVDEGYVTRDPAGRVYAVRPSDAGRFMFEVEVDSVDPIEIVRSARAEREGRRQRAGVRGRQSN